MRAPGVDNEIRQYLRYPVSMGMTAQYRHLFIRVFPHEFHEDISHGLAGKKRQEIRRAGFTLPPGGFGEWGDMGQHNDMIISLKRVG